MSRNTEAGQLYMVLRSRGRTRAAYQAVFTPAQEAQVGNALRALMNNNGFGGVKLVGELVGRKDGPSAQRFTGYEHNWVDAAAYPVQLMQANGSAFAGVAFHCYEGSYQQVASFTSQFPNAEVYLTECTGTVGSDWWSDIKWYMSNMYVSTTQVSS